MKKLCIIIFIFFCSTSPLVFSKGTVQETLGHSNISTSAGYAHIIERGQARYTRQIPVGLRKEQEEAS